MTEHRYSYSAFSPPAARQTSVALLRNLVDGDHRLVTSISTRKSTEVLRINLRSGRLELENDATAESSYENESEALDHLQERGYEVVERGYALLGYAVAGPTAGLLLATRVREKAVLPGGHTVYAVTDSQWTLVPLQNEAADAAMAAAAAGLPPPRAATAAQEFWRALQQFTLNNAHYYCETADISRPFPSDRDPRDPNPEFVWNSWLRQPLVELGLYDHCPTLLQGAVECSTLMLPGSARFSMCLISRRSRRHPGTRYIARGLNSLAGPGNEIECELVTWTHPEQRHFGAGAADSSGSGGGSSTGGFSATSFSGLPGAASAGSGGGHSEPLKWARVVWRRGTVPIWWGVQLQSLAQGLQAEVYVREEHPYQGTASYFRNVQRQHIPNPAMPSPLAAAGAGGAGAHSHQRQQQEGAGEPGSGGGGGNEGWTLVEGGEAAAGTAAAAAGPGSGPGPHSAQQQQVQQGQQAGQPLSEGELSQMVAVTCINLLHANPKKASELMLSSHFQDAMRHVRRRLGGEAPIKVVNFDWHGNMGRLTEEKAVEGFWSLMEPFVKQTGFAFGWMEAEAGRPEGSASAGQQGGLPAVGPGGSGGGAGSASTSGTPATFWPPGWRMRWAGQQSGLLRFNCADSLDRTNAATCFAMLPVLQEQLRMLGVPLECNSAPAAAALLRSRQRSSAGDVAALAQQVPQAQQAQQAVDPLEAVARALPEGWEVRQHEGRLLYIDHNSKTTQWTPPPEAAAAAAAAAATAATASGSGSRPGGRPLSARRMIESASGVLAKLQQRSMASPGAGGSLSPGKGTLLQSLERRSSPPRVHQGEAGHYWSRNSSSGSLNGGGVPHAASAPDVSAASSRATTAASEVPGSPGPEERDPRRPWAFFDYDINDVRERLYRDAVSDYVEMFRVHGDIHSFLYTGSPAMHSHVLSLVVQGGKGYGATSGVGKLQNLRVAVQRRWNNTVSDTSRQQAMELFLGLRIHDSPDQKGYFPGLQVAYRDTTQALLGGMEPFETAPLPPAHSRHASTGVSPGPLGPLGAGAPAADAAAAAVGAGAEPSSVPRLQLLAEEDLEAEAEAAAEAAAAAGEAGEYEDRAHAVPGVPAVEHDGVLGVRQSLIDLEPLSELSALEQQQHTTVQPPSMHHHQASGHSRLAGSAHSSGSSDGDQRLLQEGAVAASPAPPAAFDPLGAVLHPLPPEGEQQHQEEQLMGTAGGGDELISFDGANGTPAGGLVAAGAPATSPDAARTQLEDLLL
ncbi:hypothetical protein ABPG75_011621 [Micractinium tetrahymenae]